MCMAEKQLFRTALCSPLLFHSPLEWILNYVQFIPTPCISQEWNMQHLIWASRHHWPLRVDHSSEYSSLGNGCDSTHLMLGSILWGRSSLQMRKLRHSKIKSKNQNGSFLKCSLLLRVVFQETILLESFLQQAPFLYFSYTLNIPSP